MTGEDDGEDGLGILESMDVREIYRYFLIVSITCPDNVLRGLHVLMLPLQRTKHTM